MNYLIIVTIGPVQSYISQARRTQDLFQGSRMLSYLAGVGVYKAHELGGFKQVIYPVLPEVKSGKEPASEDYGSIPNRIMIGWNGDEATAKEHAGNIVAAIKKAWQDVAKHTYAYFLKDIKKSLPEDKPLTPGQERDLEKRWDNQVKNWLECYWIVSPADKTYPENIRISNQAMGARKLMRNFPYIEEFGRKDSITGEQGILLDEDLWVSIRDEQHNRALLNSSERLGAISTIKRFAHEEYRDNNEWQAINPPLQIHNRYPSTSSIAAAPFKYDVLDVLKVILDKNKHNAHSEADRQTLKEAILDFIGALLACYTEDTSIPLKEPGEHNPSLNLFFTHHGDFNPEYFPYFGKKLSNYETSQGRVSEDKKFWLTQFMCIDGDYLFEDTLILKTIEEYLPPIAEEDKKGKWHTKRRDALRPKVKKALKVLQALKSAASALDIAPPQPYLAILSMDGDHMGKTLGCLEEDEHQKFSEILANFAKTNVPHLVQEDHIGRLVYAGGDDVLALVSVRDALDVAEELRSGFEAIVAKKKITNHKGERITASTGLVFVHHTHDLQSAIRAANHAQKIAKEKLGRNAIFMQLLRRSGEPREMGTKWHVEGSRIIPHLQILQHAFQHNILGRSLPYDIERIAYQMGGVVVQQAREAEIRRVIERRLATLCDKAYEKIEKSAIFKLVDTEQTYPGIEKQYSVYKSMVADVVIELTRMTPNLTHVQHFLELARFIAQKESNR